MTNEIKTFIEKFKVISKKGWIRNENKSWGSVGLTFEKQLGKKLIQCSFQTIMT